MVPGPGYRLWRPVEDSVTASEAPAGGAQPTSRTRPS
jgi:hypothetical protein